MPTRNCKAQFGVAIKIAPSAWLVNMKPQNKQMLCRISPRRTCNPCDYTMKISSRYQRLLIYDVKRSTNIDGMGPFK